MLLRSSRTTLCLSLVLLPLGGCGGPPAEFGPAKVVAKDRRPIEWDLPSKGRLHVPSMGGQSRAGGETQRSPEPSQFAGATPTGWEELAPDPGTFRNLRWRVAGEPETDCYLSLNIGGGLARNVPRWYQQFDQPAADPATMPTVPFAGGDGRLVELEGSYQGKADRGMLLVFSVAGDQVTSLKFLGPAAVVKRERAAFLGLAASLHAAAAASGVANARDPGPAAAGGTWRGSAPAGWEELPPDPGTFRNLRWRVAGEPETDCYLSLDIGGGTAMNVPRWYQQFGQPAVDPATLPAVPFAGGDGRLVELEGEYQGKTDRGMLLVFTVAGSKVTSLKFLGPTAVVKAQRAAFLKLAASLRPGGASPPSGVTTLPPPPQHQRTEPPVGATGEPFAATIPAGWAPKAGSNKPLHHSFGADGEVYVSELSGDVRQMLEIWRGELGQPPMTDAQFAALPRCEMLGPNAWLLDIQGDYVGMSGKRIAGARELVAVQKEGNAITFAKLLGAGADVAAQVDAFRAFCASLRRNP
ncbi:MAG: hypothetical protein U1E73_13410 [Planctomycetota bacterium]